MKNSASSQYVEMTTDDVKKYLNIIVDNKIPLRRKRKNGDYSFIPTKEFDKYLKAQNLTFFIDKDTFAKLLKHHGLQSQTSHAQTVNELHIDSLREPKIDDVYAEGIKEAEQMTMQKRIEAIFSNNIEIRKYITARQGFDAQTIYKLGLIFSQTLCINKAAFEENARQPIEQAQLKKIVNGTYTLIDNLIYMIRKGKATYKNLANLDNIQTGSNTLNHMNRMLIRFISFLFFYNSYFQKQSTEIKKFRAHFKETFHSYYNKVIDGSQKLSLEIVFKGGISPIKDRELFIQYVLSGFLHDIGKFPEIKYHDGSKIYDIKKASKHVFDGYNMLVHSGEFSKGIIAVSLLHHDYYGAPFGYRQLETFKSKFIDRRETQREQSPTKYFISHNINDVGFGTTFSYFPNKMLELLDVYDAMTDKEIKFRTKAFTPKKAIDIMREEYLEGNKLGLDPILYNIFVDFLHISGEIDQLTVSKTKILKKK